MGTNLAGTNLAGTNLAGTNVAGTNLAAARRQQCANSESGTHQWPALAIELSPTRAGLRLLRDSRGLIRV
jgi:hypothetical protein